MNKNKLHRMARSGTTHTRTTWASTTADTQTHMAKEARTGEEKEKVKEEMERAKAKEEHTHIAKAREDTEREEMEKEKEARAKEDKERLDVWMLQHQV